MQNQNSIHCSTSAACSNAFVQRHATDVTGILSGWDRMVVRGTLRKLYYPRGMLGYLALCRILLKDFKAFTVGLTARILEAASEWAQRHRRPERYLGSGKLCKETIAREIAVADGVSQGAVALLRCVEQCQSYTVAGNHRSKKLELRFEPMRCQHLYFYQIHRVLGWMFVRVQTWFPFEVHIYFNGREWLARQLDAAGIGYQRVENCFTALEDPARAQALFDDQLCTNWPALFESLLAEVHPLYKEITRPLGAGYYWAVMESEYATDVMFRQRAPLQALYPSLLRHGLITFGAPQVLRFLGRHVNRDGGVNARLHDEVTTDLKRRPEGMRIKHRAGKNTLKMYDKAGTVLRVETTINQSRDFKVYRTREGACLGEAPRNRPLRSGVADLHRRAQVSAAANERYLQALASVEAGRPLGQLAEPVCRALVRDGRRYRGLRPWSGEDQRLLAIVSRGEFAIQGIRNRDVRRLLFGEDARDPMEKRRRSARVSRQLRLLRAHGILHKIAGTQYYRLSDKGRLLLSALSAAHQADAQSLTRLAA